MTKYDIDLSKNSIPYFGIYGVCEFFDTKYIMAITQCSIAGNILKAPIFLINHIEFIPFKEIPRKHNQKNLSAIKMFREILSMNCLYFSPIYDLTLPLQRYISLYGKNLSGMVLKGADKSDKRYFVNYNYEKYFITNGITELILPVIQGFVESKYCKIQEKNIDLMLISRKDIYRNGRRFITRGADKEGNVANMVETEHILIHNDNSFYKVASYLQIRGSMPLIWQQKPDLKWSPKVVFNIEESEKPCAEHYRSLIKTYEKIVMDMISVP